MSIAKKNLNSNFLQNKNRLPFFFFGCLRRRLVCQSAGFVISDGATMICHPDTMSGLIPKLMGGACFENHLLITNYWLDTKLLIETSRRHTSESAAKHLLLFKKKEKKEIHSGAQIIFVLRSTTWRA